MADEAPWVDWRKLLSARRRQDYSLSWLSLRALASSANDLIGKHAPELVDHVRARWVAEARQARSEGRWNDDFVVSMPDARSFLVVGDTGEQDASQYVVAPALACHTDVAAMIICSDVIYPAGNVN